MAAHGFLLLKPGKFLDARNLYWLAKAVEGDEFGYNSTSVLKMIYTNEAQFWEMRKPAEGTIITQISSYPAGSFMFVWYIAGKKFIKNISEIYAELKENAAYVGCVGMYGQAKRFGMEKVYSDIGAKKVGSNFILRF